MRERADGREHPHASPFADTHTDSDTDTHTDSHTHTDSDTDTHTDTHTDCSAAGAIHRTSVARRREHPPPHFPQRSATPLPGPWTTA